MEGGNGSEAEREHDDDSVSKLLQDRFRLSAISIAEAQAKSNGMEIPEPITACIVDLAYKYAEQVAKDLELFAQHAGRKSVKMEDVILCGLIENSHLDSTLLSKAEFESHRNEHLAASLRSFCIDLKAKEPQSESKRKKKSKKDDDAMTSDVHMLDN